MLFLWKSYLPAAFILLAGAAAFVLLARADKLPPTYEASAVIGLSPPEGREPGTFQRYQAVLLLSQPVLKAALKGPKAAGVVKGKTVHSLEGKFKIDTPQPNLLTVRMTGDDSDEPLILLKAILGACVTASARIHGNPPPARVVVEPAVRKSD